MEGGIIEGIWGFEKYFIIHPYVEILGLHQTRLKSTSM
jgi:hypothetical protein